MGQGRRVLRRTLPRGGEVQVARPDGDVVVAEIDLESIRSRMVAAGRPRIAAMISGVGEEFVERHAVRLALAQEDPAQAGKIGTKRSFIRCVDPFHSLSPCRFGGGGSGSCSAKNRNMPYFAPVDEDPDERRGQRKGCQSHQGDEAERPRIGRAATGGRIEVNHREDEDLMGDTLLDFWSVGLVSWWSAIAEGGLTSRGPPGAPPRREAV